MSEILHDIIRFAWGIPGSIISLTLFFYALDVAERAPKKYKDLLNISEK